MVGAVIELSTAALRVASLIPLQNKFLYDPHLRVVVTGLVVSVYEFKCL